MHLGKKTMSGIDDLMANSNDRWVQAVRRSQGIADNGLGEALKTYYTRYFPAGFVILAATGTIGGILAFGASDWQNILVFGFFLAMLGVVIGGLTYNAKKVVPAAKTGRVGVLLSLESEERKHVRRQIAGKATIEPKHLPVTRAAAVQMRKGLATQLLLAPMFPILFIPQAVRFAIRNESPFDWLMAVAVAGLVIVIVLLIRDFRRTGRFLAHTAEQASPRNSSLGQP